MRRYARGQRSGRVLWSRVLKHNPVQFDFKLVDEHPEVWVLDHRGFSNEEDFNRVLPVVVSSAIIAGKVPEDVVGESGQVAAVIFEGVFLADAHETS